jgi:hypothetical protein
MTYREYANLRLDEYKAGTFRDGHRPDLSGLHCLCNRHVEHEVHTWATDTFSLNYDGPHVAIVNSL